MLRLACEDGAALVLLHRYRCDAPSVLPGPGTLIVDGDISGEKSDEAEEPEESRAGRTRHRRSADYVYTHVPVAKQVAEEVFVGVKGIWNSKSKGLKTWLPKYFPVTGDGEAAFETTGAPERERGDYESKAVETEPLSPSSLGSSGLTDFQLPTVPQQHFDDSSKISPGDSITLQKIRPTHSHSGSIGSIGSLGDSGIEHDVKWQERRALIIKRNTVPEDLRHLSRCWYGDACRRSNPTHFKKFAHPLTHPNLQISDEWHVVDGETLSGSGDEAEAASAFIKNYEEQQSAALSRQKRRLKGSLDSNRWSRSSGPQRKSRERKLAVSAEADRTSSAALRMRSSSEGSGLRGRRRDDRRSSDESPTQGSLSPEVDRRGARPLKSHKRGEFSNPSPYATKDYAPIDGNGGGEAITSRGEFILAVSESMNDGFNPHVQKDSSSMSSGYVSEQSFLDSGGLANVAGYASEKSLTSGAYASDEMFAVDIPSSNTSGTLGGEKMGGYRGSGDAMQDSDMHESSAKQQPMQTKSFLDADSAYRAGAVQRPPAERSSPSPSTDLLSSYSLAELREIIRAASSNPVVAQELSRAAQETRPTSHSPAVSASLSTPMIGVNTASNDPMPIQSFGPLSESGYWNGRFLDATQGIRKLGPNTRQTTRVERYQSLAVHGQDFIDVAKTYGAILISEVGLDDSLKTIPPLKGKGFAGGDKYFVHGIYFKLAVDSHGLFGGSERSSDLLYLGNTQVAVENQMDGDERAMRVAGHELRHLITVFNCWSEEAHVAMCVCLDFRGFRMLAMSALPITNSTLRYGCADAAKGNEMTVCTGEEDSAVSNIMKELAQRLNLRPHRITAVDREDGHPFLFTPIDVEGHRGTDGKIYLIDLSRLFPPVNPAISRGLSSDPRSDYLVYLFRPEFVATYEKALNPDAFSPFCNDSDDQADVVKATDYLLKEVCAGFVRHLHTVGLASNAMLRSYPLVQMVHVHGINVRFLGNVRAMFTEANMVENNSTPEVRIHWRTTLLMEMVARVVKQLLRKRLRDETYALRQRGNVFSNPWKRVIVESFNYVFGALGTEQSVHASRTTRMWDIIFSELLRRFPNALDPVEIEWVSIQRQSPGGAAALRDLLVKYCSPMKVTIIGDDDEPAPPQDFGFSSDARCVLFRSLCDMLGLDFTTQSFDLATRNPRVFDFQRPFEDTDLVDFVQRAKQLNIVAHAQGFLLRTKAVEKEVEDEAQRLYQNAIDHFRNALYSDPSNKHSLRNLAECLACSEQVEEADFCFQAALNSDQEDTNTLFKYATFLDFSGRADDAEDVYLRALEAHPYHSNCLVAYADFLACVRRNPTAALPFYEAAVGCDPSSPFAHNNMACVIEICSKGGDLAAEDRASASLRVAVDCAPQLPTLLRNLAIQLHATAERRGEAGRIDAEAAKQKYVAVVDRLRAVHYVEDPAAQNRDSFIQ